MHKQCHVDAVFSKRRLVQPAFARARLDDRLPPQIRLEVDEPSTGGSKASCVGLNNFLWLLF